MVIVSFKQFYQEYFGEKTSTYINITKISLGKFYKTLIN